MSNSYSVSLQIWHPDADPQDIIAGFGLPPKRYWKVGDQRVRPNGIPLEGRYRESYCVFDLEDGGGRELSRYLADVLTTLESSTEFIRQLRDTGGKVSFYIIWERGDGRGDSFDVPLLSTMARIGIDLGIQTLF
ncbi:DUF4279 domain-containing protein [Sphingomonas sp. HF-S3]|uniref:DUF4279 domain-containing protein n=1 Tax=Sphingomonas rustica TaxID=3103142 RepID=A0ABV0BD73_9SPHN